MKLTVTRNIKEDIDIELTEKQLLDITIDTLCKHLNWKRSFFIKNDKVFEPITYVSSHTWIDEKFTRDASNEDLAINKLISGLKSKLIKEAEQI